MGTAAMPGRHFVQYHNPDRVGHGHDEPADFRILTNKPLSLLEALPGNTVWLIMGEGRPRRYSMQFVFVVAHIGECDERGFRWFAQGTEGHRFHPRPRLDGDPFDGDPWFPLFLRRQANFSLGLRELARDDVTHLRRLAWPGTRAGALKSMDNVACRPI